MGSDFDREDGGWELEARRKISLQEYVLFLWGISAAPSKTYDYLDGREATTLVVFDGDDQLTVTRYAEPDDGCWLIALIATALMEQDAFSAD